jgi:uncharacterized protein involved in exopolysaccharide biosynthesis
VGQELSTREFAERVAAEASKATATPVDWREVQNGAWAADSGDNLVVIGFTGPDPVRAQAIAAAVISQYQESAREQTLADAREAEEFYEGEANSAQAALAAATTELAEYKEANPITSDVDNALLADPQLAVLQGEVDRARDVYNQSLSALLRTRQLIAQTDQTRNETFDVRDLPEVPPAPLTRNKLELVGPPAIALLAAIAICAAAFGFIYSTDKTLYTAEDAAMVPHIRLLGTVTEVPPAEPAPRDFLGARRLFSERSREGGGYR